MGVSEDGGSWVRVGGWGDRDDGTRSIVDSGGMGWVGHKCSSDDGDGGEL